MLLKTIIVSCLLVISVDAKSHYAQKIAKQTIHFSDGTIKKGGHRNWRNNNPGNLEYGKFTKDNGAIGTDGRFAIFSSMSDGYKAQVKLLSGKKYKNKTLSQAIKRYAPHFENNTNRYISFLSKKLHISRHKKLKHLSYNKKINLVKLMAKYEGMKRGSIFESKRKYKLSSRNRLDAYLKEDKDVIFDMILNPKKTRLHKILLSS